ncbi:MAG: spore germination protein, partial [Acutalibacter sp.]|nr:spore germination protein [Acutalibacter sp.]
MAALKKLEKVSARLEENQQYLQKEFENAMDFMMRELELSGARAALFGLDGLVSKQIITLSILNPLLEARQLTGQGPGLMEQVEKTVLGSVEQKRESQMDQLLLLLMSGFAVLCIDGCGEALVFGVQGFESRGPDEPQNEVMQRGAKDGFNESYQNNISMIRRRMKTTALKFEKAEVGSKSH